MLHCSRRYPYIVFLGNIITNGGEWKKLFGNPNVKNKGISGDVCQGVIDRLDVITKGKPAKIFRLIGVNCLARGTATDSVVLEIKNIIDSIQTKSPNTNIYLQSILPLNESFGMFGDHTKHRKV